MGALRGRGGRAACLWRAATLAGYPIVLAFDPALALFLRGRPADGVLRVRYDGTSSLGHVVEAAGVPLPEAGEIRVGGRPARTGDRVPPGARVTVAPAPRPQPLPGREPRFCLDVHLGALARRLRLLGLDTWYRNDAGDDDLIAVAASRGAVLLTQDRALLRRRAVRSAAFVRGAGPDAQMVDVLDRFAPPLAPWTRCPSCNGALAPVAKKEVEGLLEPGTRRTYQEFARCQACGRPYWRGAHARRLDALVERAVAAVSRRVSAGGGAGAAGAGQAPSGTPAR